MRCLILDDEPLARHLLATYAAKIPGLQVLATLASPLDALARLREQPVDLLFLDIQLPDLTGLALLRLLPQPPLVVLTTAYAEYALEGYELDVVDYLLKPITLDRFLRAVHKAQVRLGRAFPSLPASSVVDPTEITPFLLVKEGARLVKVRWADLLFAEGLRDYVALHTRQQKVVALLRLKQLVERLPTDRFVRIHHSYLVSLDAIDAVFKDKVQIGSRMLPISESYRTAFRECIARSAGTSQ